MAKKSSTPTEFMIDAMDSLDDVALVLVVRRHKDGAISYDCNTHSLWDSFALAQASAASLNAQVVVKELCDIDRSQLP